MPVKTQIKNLYEVTVIFKASHSEEDLGKNVQLIESAIKNYGGSIVKIDEPIRRKFTHPIKGVKEGFYLAVHFNSPPELPNTLKKTLSLSDNVLRYMVIRK